MGVSGAAVETIARRGKRRFTAAEKLRIVKKAEACLGSGERGALEAMLRQEGIYSSLLSKWRGLFAAGGATGLASGKPGRRPKLDAKERRTAELEKRNAELERKLRLAESLLALKKKADEIWGLSLQSSDGEV